MSSKRKNNLCFLCYKPTSEKDELQYRKLKKSSDTKFLLLLLRHLKLHPKSEVLSNAFECCEDCAMLGKYFCDLFFQLECIQLQLNSKLQRLYDGMLYAGRIPSRVIAFRTQFENLDENKEEIESPSQMSFIDTQEARNYLIKCCELKLKSGVPAVLLKRIFQTVDNPTEIIIKDEVANEAPTKFNSTFPQAAASKGSHTSKESCEYDGGDDTIPKSFNDEVHTQNCCDYYNLTEHIGEHNPNDSQLATFSNPTLGFEENISEIDIEYTQMVFKDDPNEMETEENGHKTKTLNNYDDEASNSDYDSDDYIHEHDLTDKNFVPLSHPIQPQTFPGASSKMVVKSSEIAIQKQNPTEMETREEQPPQKNRLPKVPNEKEQEEMTPTKSLRSLLRCPMCSKTFSNQKNMDFHIKFHDDNVEADDNNKDTKNSDCGPIKLEENTSDSDSDVELEDDDEHIHSDGEMSGSQKANPAKRKPSRYKKVFKPPRNKKLPFTQCEICLVNYSCEAAVEKCRVVNHNLKNYVCCHSCRKLFPCHLFLIYHRTKRPLTNTCLTNNPKDFVPAAAPLFPFQKRIMGHKFCEVEGCYEVFNYEESLKIHAKTHGKWSCTFCPEEFEKAHDFAAHELSKHNNSKKPATEDEIREAGNSNEEALDISRKEAIGTQRLRCSRCTTSYEKRTALMDHFLHKHLDIPKPIEKSGPRCEICKRTFHPEVTQKDMNKHAFTHDVEGLTPEQISKCTICQAPFRHRIQLSNHMRLVHNQKPVYKCRYCEKQYKTFTSFSKHTTQKHKGKPRGLTGIFECPICKDRVDSEYNLKMHLLQHKDDDKLVFKCETCQKSFSKKWHLYKHVKNMHEQPKKTWHCDKCGKVFKTSTKLEQHTSYTHTDPSQWRFACPEEGCLKRCWSRQKLTEHIRTHTKERPFICDFCGESYRYRQYLRTHLAKVHGPSAAKTLPTQSYTKPFDQEVKEKVVAGAEFSEPGSSMDISKIEVQMEVDARPTPSVKTVLNKINGNSAEILMDGDISAELHEEEGTLHLDVPDLSTVKEILGLDFQVGSFRTSSAKHQLNVNLNLVRDRRRKMTRAPLFPFPPAT
ncbi:unnamed protein product [Orchesella dallaii]|uniref:C2H2-type domain-containing protein n=1 Tax=Orchesella dallaii TaxID=48710 RepID=A0ABP1S4L9_9HEXA